MTDLENSNNKIDYVIVANGPFLASPIITEIVHNRKIIALDGAARRLADMNIMPDIILGDFDSLAAEEQKFWGIKKIFAQLDEDDKPYSGNHDVLIVPAKNQNFTDLTKAVFFCDSYYAQSIDIICAISDNRLDLTLANISLLRGQYKKNRSLRLHTVTQTVVFARNETIEIAGQPNDYCGIIGFNDTTFFTSSGLKYNGNNTPLNFGFADSVANQLKDSKGLITVKGEALIIQPGVFSTQRSGYSSGSSSSI